MDRIFDRLTNLVRSLMQDDSSSSPGQAGDPDLDEAMEELDEFLATGRSASSTPVKPPERNPLSDELRRAFTVLECSPSDDLHLLKKAYKRLLRTYHPDKHGDHPEKQRVATEITQKLNDSYRRVCRYKEAAALD